MAEARALEEAPPPPAESFWLHAGHVLRGNPVTLLAFVLLAGLVLVAVLGPWLAPYDPLESNAARALQPPSLAHWFGTDNLGRDVFSRVLVATRLDLLISVTAVALSFLVGSFLGCIAGYFGGWLDAGLNRLLDMVMAFPLFVLAMGIVAALGNTVENIVYATAIINVPFYARLVRAEVNIRRDAGFVQAARLAGTPEAAVLALHIFPNALALGQFFLLKDHLFIRIVYPFGRKIERITRFFRAFRRAAQACW